MAKVITTPGQDLREIARRAGGDPSLIILEPRNNELEVPDVTQPALDAAYLDYDTNQAAIDAANKAARTTAIKEASKKELDDNRTLTAMTEALADELPGVTFAQLRTNIRNKIDAAP